MKELKIILMTLIQWIYFGIGFVAAVFVGGYLLSQIYMFQAKMVGMENYNGWGFAALLLCIDAIIILLIGAFITTVKEKIKLEE